LNDYIKSEVGKTIEVMTAILADTELMQTVEAIAATCASAIKSGGKVMFCGNGGSAGDSQHLAWRLQRILQR
jgi:D-sedoheptulose 7-phosphate isomerase